MFRQKKKESDNVFLKLHHQSIRCFSVKDSVTYRETILGREGRINVAEGEMIVICRNREVFRKPCDCLQIAELMSRDGFTLRDLSEDNGATYVAYFVK